MITQLTVFNTIRALFTPSVARESRSGSLPMGHYRTGRCSSRWHRRTALARLVVLVFGIAVGFPAGVEASSAAALLPTAAQRIRFGGTMQEYRDDHRAVAFVPNHPLAEEIHRVLNDQQPNVISERIVVTPRGVTAEEQLELFNSLRRVSALAGLQYYNPRRQEWLTLFHSSQTIDGPRSQRVIPDQEVTTIPREETLYVLQNTPPFGDIVYQYHYRSDGAGAFLFRSLNQDPLVYRRMRVARPEQTFSYILVIPGEDYVVTYGIGGVRAFTLFGLLDDRIEAAFGGRTDGIFDWYYREYLQPLEPSDY